VPEARDKALERLADRLSDGVALCRNGRIVWASAPLARMAARSPEALVGTRPEALLTDDVAPGAAPQPAGLRQPDGTARAVCVARCPSEAADTELWVFHEAQRLRTLEAEVHAASRALRETNLELEALRERLRRQSAELDEALTVVSHELRTPVTVVTGYARLLLSEKVGPLNEQQRGFLEQSIRSCQRMNTFIANLLASSRGATGDAPLQVQEASLAPTVQSAVAAMKPLLEQHRVDLVLDLEAPAPARFDPLRIEQVVSNLLENAIKYTPPGGRIEIRATAVARDGRREVELSVADQGPGVPAADRERIFERYVRAGEARRAGGLGLGLAICKRAVEAHGGVMGVTDAPEGGARFWLTLPAAGGAGSGPGGDEAEAEHAEREA